MSGRKGMKHHRVEIKQEAVRLALEKYMIYVAVAVRLEVCKAGRIKAWVQIDRHEGELLLHKPIGRTAKRESEEWELERLQMENALLKNHTKLRKAQLA